VYIVYNARSWNATAPLPDILNSGKNTKAAQNNMIAEEIWKPYGRHFCSKAASENFRKKNCL